MTTTNERNLDNQQIETEPSLGALDTLNLLVHRPDRLRDWLNHHLAALLGPTIDAVAPTAGQRGTVVTVKGSNFSPTRTDNAVTVGGYPAFVLSATPDELTVLTGPDTDTGPVKVAVGGHTATSTADFVVTGYPAPGSGDDGPPVVVEGVGSATPGDVNPIGTIRVLVVMLQCSDRHPANAATTRNTVTGSWNNVHTYYDQVSYGQTDVAFDVTNFGNLDGTFADFVDTGTAQNIRHDQLGRIAAIAAQTAVNQGFHLDDYQMMCSIVFTNGAFVRAWGGGSQSTFSYDNGLPAADPNRIHINLTANHQINTLYINESADWGRFAHEFGHNIVSAPTQNGDGTATLGEDVYGSDLVDPGAATAQNFELMGNHDAHPIFTGFHLEKLGYYNSSNVSTLNWDRNPFSQTFDIIAHSLTQDNAASRIHILKIKVSDALSYYIEVRQRPGATAQIFDSSIPIGGAANQGGVIVTRVIAGDMHNNQQTRFITLMHPNRVLLTNDFVEDPARALRITVLDDNVQARPQVCRVRVEWAQTIANDPNGSFDLRVEPWDSNWQTPDIWVDRDPFGSFDSSLDSQGRPLGNGDRPRTNAINHLTARVHVSGAMGASNVKLTFYAVTPPGVGDNGNWAPIATTTIPSISTNSYADSFTNWVPVVGRHTCLRVFASAQLGEISGSNNSAQENVFDFQSAGNSPCDPVLIRTAIRNPLSEPRPVKLELHGLPEGWAAQLPFSWIWLDGLAEREIDVAIWPTKEFEDYKVGDPKRQDRRGELPGVAPVRVNGQIPRDYDVTVLDDGNHPGSRFYAIGGTFYQVHVRRRSTIDIEKTEFDNRSLLVFGFARPATPDQRVVIDLTAPSGELVGEFNTRTAANGSFQLQADVERIVAEAGPGSYGVQAFIFDADELADAESRLVQIKI